MLTHPTLDQLRALNLDGMVQAFIELEAQEEARNLAHAEWLALLLDREAANRNTKRFQSRLRSAKLRHGQASVEDVDYRTPRRLDKALFQQLACAVKRRRFPVGARPTRQPLQPEATGAVMEVTKWLKPSDSGSRIGDRASVQAAT